MLTPFAIPWNFLTAPRFWITSQVEHSWEASQWGQRALEASSDSSIASIPRHPGHPYKVNFATRFDQILMNGSELLCIHLNVIHMVHHVLLHQFIKQLLCATLCMLNLTLISTLMHFGIYWCHLQGVKSNRSFFSAHLKSNFISDAQWL